MASDGVATEGADPHRPEAPRSDGVASGIVQAQKVDAEKCLEPDSRRAPGDLEKGRTSHERAQGRPRPEAEGAPVPGLTDSSAADSSRWRSSSCLQVAGNVKAK